MEHPGRQPLSQHFLHDRRLVDRLVRASSLTSNDLVVEIGPGRGILTEALLRTAARVIAVELDARLCGQLRARWADEPRLTLVAGDFLEQPLPQQPYKVFASLPYRRTSDILRKLLHARPAPEDGYLVVQREAAARFAPNPHSNRLAALLYYPWWAIDVIHHFARTDFAPPPRVESVLLRLARRERPLLPAREAEAYRDYAAYRFEHDRHAHRQTPAAFLSAFRQLARDAQACRRRPIRGAYARLEAQQRALEKSYRTRNDPAWRRYGRKG